MGLPLEKKTGTNFGPPGNSKLVYFLDDLNLSEVHARVLEASVHRAVSRKQSLRRYGDNVGKT